MESPCGFVLKNSCLFVPGALASLLSPEEGKREEEGKQCVEVGTICNGGDVVNRHDVQEQTAHDDNSDMAEPSRTSVWLAFDIRKCHGTLPDHPSW